MKLNRETLIESIGIQATEVLEDIQRDIEAIHKHLKVTRVFQTTGWKLASDHPTRLPPKHSKVKQTKKVLL